MKKKLFKALQVVLLFAALALTGSALVPQDAQAVSLCDTASGGSCNFGPEFCDIVEYNGRLLTCYFHF